MFGVYKLPIWNEITLELEDVDKIKKMQMIPVSPKLFLLTQKEPDISQIFVFHSSSIFSRLIQNIKQKHSTESKK